MRGDLFSERLIVFDGEGVLFPKSMRLGLRIFLPTGSVIVTDK